MESVAAALGQGEALARSSQPVNYAPGRSSYSFNEKILFIHQSVGQM